MIVLGINLLLCIAAHIDQLFPIVVSVGSVAYDQQLMVQRVPPARQR